MERVGPVGCYAVDAAILELNVLMRWVLTRYRIVCTRRKGREHLLICRAGVSIAERGSISTCVVDKMGWQSFRVVEKRVGSLISGDEESGI